MKRMTLIVAMAALAAAGCGYAQPGQHAMMMHSGPGMMGRGPAVPAAGADTASTDNGRAEGARLTRQACGVCHAPPAPGLHSPQQWPPVIQRMRAYRRNYGLPALTDDQVTSILHYLQGSDPSGNGANRQ